MEQNLFVVVIRINVSNYLEYDDDIIALFFTLIRSKTVSCTEFCWSYVIGSRYARVKVV